MSASHRIPRKVRRAGSRADKRRARGHRVVDVTARIAAP
jgi:hypothetical protein